MIPIIKITVKIVLTASVLLIYILYILASLITWDIKYLDICDETLKSIWFK